MMRQEKKSKGKNKQNKGGKIRNYFERSLIQKKMRKKKLGK